MFRWSHTDLLRLKDGKVGGQLWTAYAPCGSQHKDAVQITLEQIDLIKRMVELYPHILQLAQTAQGTYLFSYLEFKFFYISQKTPELRDSVNPELQDLIFFFLAHSFMNRFDKNNSRRNFYL